MGNSVFSSQGVLQIHGIKLSLDFPLELVHTMKQNEAVRYVGMTPTDKSIHILHWSVTPTQISLLFPQKMICI